MIEFEIRYFDDGSPQALSTIAARFRANDVEVVITQVAQLSPQDWDAIRAGINNHSHQDWDRLYRRTPVAPHVGFNQLTASGMMAVAALHLLAPDWQTAKQMEAAPLMVAQTYGAKGTRSDGLGNSIGMAGPIPPNQAAAVHELMQKRWLQQLVVRIGAQPAQDFYFRPFHCPGTATSQFSPAALTLKSSLP